MTKLHSTICIPLAVCAMMVGVFGCTSKAVQSGGETQSSQQGAKTGTGLETGQGTAPNTSYSGRDSSNGLRGLDKNPSEERVGGETNTLTAKADSGSADRQMNEIRTEQAATEAAGLQDVFFAFDSFVITAEGRQALSRDAEWIKAHQGAQLTIEGHCDERGTSAYNLVLGEKRAKVVRNYLVELGVSPNRLGVVSYGKERPFCMDHDESCYAQNRRAHVVIKSSK